MKLSRLQDAKAEQKRKHMTGGVDREGAKKEKTSGSSQAKMERTDMILEIRGNGGGGRISPFLAKNRTQPPKHAKKPPGEEEKPDPLTKWYVTSPFA